MLTDEERQLLRLLCASKATGRDSSGGYRRDIDARLVLMLLDDYDRIRPVYDAAVPMRAGHEGCVTEPPCGACFRCDFDRAVDMALAKATPFDAPSTPERPPSSGRTGSP